MGPNTEPQVSSPAVAMASEAMVRVTLRPQGTPLPLGFLGLFVATVSFSALQLDWIPETEGKTVALAALGLTVPLQLIASVFGFLARDPVAGTGMGVLAGTWAAAGLATLTSRPGTASDGLGVVLLASAVALLAPALAAHGKLVAAAVMGLSSLRFALTGLAELRGTDAWMTAAGFAGLLLAVVSLYAAFGFELEDVEGRTVLPLLRRGKGAAAVTDDLAGQTGDIATQPGVRRQL